MAKKIELSETIQAAMRLPAVTAAVEAQARIRLAKAQQEAYRAGRVNLGDALHLEGGVRPGTKSPTGIRRPFARITATLTEDEQNEDSRRAKLSTIQILRRAARG